jgi:hypothetical protein
MGQIFCRKCGEYRSVQGYERDDPILSCGHVKHRTDIDDGVHKARREIETMFEEEAEDRGASIKEIRDEYIRGLLDLFEHEADPSTVGHCEICGTVTIVEDEEGVLRCGGNLHDNPGCGMPLEAYQHQQR